MTQPSTLRRDAAAALRTEIFRIGQSRISACLVPGEGPAVVFLHGNSSTKSVWENQIRLVSGFGRAVLAPDFPGHGESGDSCMPETSYSFPGYAAVVAGLLDRTGFKTVDVVGWSLGGHVGLELLATDSRIRSLLIVGTPPVRLRPQSLPEAFYADADMQLAGQRHFSEADALAYGLAMMGGPAHLRPDLLDCIKRTDGNARHWMFANAMAGIGADQRHAVETIDKPLCVVHGENEPFVRLGYLQSLNYRHLWTNAVQVIAGAGHAPHWQRPAAFNQILRAFLGATVERKT